MKIKISESQLKKIFLSENFLPKPSACEIQKFLENKGFLKKGEYQYCKFKDETARALGKYIESRVGANLNIQTVGDLQNYMSVIGFDTGSLGFGNIMANEVSILIGYLENLMGTIKNNPIFFNIIKLGANIVARNLVNEKPQLNEGNDYFEFGTEKTHGYWSEKVIPDIIFEYPITLKKLTFKEINEGSAKFSGVLEFKFKGQVAFYDTLDYTDIKFDVDMNYILREETINKKKHMCINFIPVNVNLNSFGLQFDKNYWTLGINDNVLNLDFGTIAGYDVGDVNLGRLDIVEELKKEKLKFCISHENLLKIVTGEVELSKDLFLQI